MMEESQNSAPKVRSVMDELRAIQAQFIPAANRGDADGAGPEETRAREELLTPVSPSDIVNSVEQDPVDSIDQASPQAPEGVAPWGQEQGVGYFGYPSVPQHGSASAAESHLASLASSTPASAAVDQAPDMDVAFTAAALGGEYESGLHAAINDLATISPALLGGSGPGGIEDARLGEDLTVVPVTASAQSHNEANSGSDDFGILPSEDTAPNEYLVALPPPARSRPEMVSIINSHSRDIDVFENYFMRGPSRSPDSKAVVKITAMLENLAELSNLPPYHKDLQDLSQEQWMKYARETSSKLAFIYELLNRLRDCNMEVVILAAGGQVMEKVEAIVSQCSFTYRHIQQQDWSKASTEQGSACKVVLVDTALRDVQPRLTENIVVAYDESAESSGLLQLYKTKLLEDQSPIIFTLVEVFSLEHINRRLSPAMDPLEKSLAQVRCLISLLEYAEERIADSVPQPHDLAEEVARYTVEDNTFSPPPTRWETWEHQQIPDEVLDAYRVFRSQLEPHREERKRAREDSTSGTDTPKRPRIDIESCSADEAQLSETLKARFGANIRVKDDMVQVSVEKLEDLVSLVEELEAALNKKGEEVNQYAKTVRRFQPKYKEAVGDRGKFQLERDNALNRIAYLEKQHQRTEMKLEQVKSDKQGLEKEYLEKIQALSSSNNPEVAAAANSQVSKDTLEATNKALIQKVDSKEKQAEYANTSYREVSQQMASVTKENAELKLRIRDLETRANANVVEIRRMNDERMRDQLRMMYDQEKNMRLDREKEIERKNEEMRNYKARFGGRDTRGSSVPRSPRVRQVSSRNTSPIGDGGGGGAGGVNGNGSNGLGVSGTLFGPGRSHLRDL